MAQHGKDCYFYYRSECAKGDRCTFRHCAAALGSDMVCDDWRNGICYMPDCPYRHEELPRNRRPVSCYWDTPPSGFHRPQGNFLHSQQQSLETVQNPKIGGSSSLVEIPLVSDVPDIPRPPQPPHAFIETFSTPSVIVTRRMSGEPDITGPQVEPIIINPLGDDESSDQESTTVPSPVKNSDQTSDSRDVKSKTEDAKDPDEGKSQVDGTKPRVDQSDDEEDGEDQGKEAAEEEEEEEESDNSEGGNEESESEGTSQEESEDNNEASGEPVIELFDTEGHEALGVEEEQPMKKGATKTKNGESGQKGKISSQEGKSSKSEQGSKEDTDLSEVLSLEEVMRRKALESMYKRRAEKEKAQKHEQEKKKKLETTNPKDGDHISGRKRDNRSRRRSWSRSPPRRGRSPVNWRYRRGMPRKMSPSGRWSSPSRRKSPDRRRHFVHHQHQAAVARLRYERDRKELELKELAFEASKLDKKIVASTENVKALRQLELKKRKELLRKQLEAVNQELENEGSDSSDSSSCSSSLCSRSSCSTSSSTESLDREPRVKSSLVSTVARSVLNRDAKKTDAPRPILRVAKSQSRMIETDSDGSVKKGISLAEIRRKRALKLAGKCSDSEEVDEGEEAKPAKLTVLKSSGEETSCSESSQARGAAASKTERVKVQPLRKINIRKVISQGDDKNSGVSLETQAKRDMQNKEALKKIKVNRILADTGDDDEVVSKRENLEQLEEAEEKTQDDEFDKLRKDAINAERKRTPTRRILVVSQEEPIKELSSPKKPEDIVVKSLEDIKKEKMKQNEALITSTTKPKLDSVRQSKEPLSRRLRLGLARSDESLLKRPPTTDESEQASKKRIIRRVPQEIYIPPVASLLRDRVKVDDPCVPDVQTLETKFTEGKSSRLDTRKMRSEPLKEVKPASGQIVVKTFSEIMREKRERKQKELEEKRASMTVGLSKSEEFLTGPKTAKISPISYGHKNPDAPHLDLSQQRRELYSGNKPRSDIGRMFTNWGSLKRKDPSGVNPEDSVPVEEPWRTDTPGTIAASQPPLIVSKADIGEDDELDLLLTPHDIELKEQELPEISVSNNETVYEKLTAPHVDSSEIMDTVASRREDSKCGQDIVSPSSASPGAAYSTSATKLLKRSTETLSSVSERKPSSDDKSRKSRMSSASISLLDDDFDLLMDDEISGDCNVTVQDDDMLLKELENMLA